MRASDYVDYLKPVDRGKEPPTVDDLRALLQRALKDAVYKLRACTDIGHSVDALERNYTPEEADRLAYVIMSRVMGLN